MRVLVTGSSGFIGRHVRAVLEARGDEVIPYDKPRSVTHLHGLRQACDGADAVINLAGVLGTPELLGSEAAAAEVNILGAVNVYDAAAWARIGGLPVVQIGTGHKGQPNPYAITKGAAEDLGLARARWLGEKISIVRAYHVYGPGQLPGAPFGPASVHKFFPTFACRAIAGEPLELCGGGTQLIDPVHVRDVAEILADAIGGPYGEVTEAGCGKPVSVAQAALDIAVTVPGRRRIEAVAPRPGEPAAAEVVAQSPACRNPWPYMVPETVEWYREWLASRPAAS